MLYQAKSQISIQLYKIHYWVVLYTSSGTHPHSSNAQNANLHIAKADFNIKKTQSCNTGHTTVLSKPPPKGKNNEYGVQQAKLHLVPLPCEDLGKILPDCLVSGA